jgi:hypothetical protein
MIQSSFPKVADQIISYNKTVVEILSKKFIDYHGSSVNVQIYDENGILRISHCHLHIIEVRDRQVE